MFKSLVSVSVSQLSKPQVSRLVGTCVAEQAGLSLTCSNISKDRFSHDMAEMSHIMRKLVFGDFQPGKIQTGLLSYRN